MKTILVPTISSWTLGIIQSLTLGGYRIEAIFTSNEDITIDEIVSLFKNITIHHYGELDLSKSEDFYDYCCKIIETCKVDYIMPTLGEATGPILMRLNNRYKLPGVNLKQSEYLLKSNYYKVLSSLNISTPTQFNLTDADTIKFPVIVKPDAGTGSLGVKVLNNIFEFNDFFIEKHLPVHPYQEKFDDGTYRHWEYLSLNSKYLIQEFIQGDVVTLNFRIVNKEIFLDGDYSITMSPLPYRAEQCIQYPSNIDEGILALIIKDVQKFLDYIELDNSPFFFDIVISDNKYYFIDFGMRFGSNQSSIFYLINNDYFSQHLRDIDNSLSKKLLSFDHDIIFHKLNIPRGKISDVDISNLELSSQYRLPKSKQEIYQFRNEIVIRKNGYIITMGDSKQTARKKMDKILNSLKIEIKK